MPSKYRDKYVVAATHLDVREGEDLKNLEVRRAKALSYLETSEMKA